MAVNPTAYFVAFAVIDCLAMILSLFRLVFRLHVRRFWWEDMWAAVVFVCGMTFIINQLLCNNNVNYRNTLVSNWMITITFTSTVWAVRMSLLYSTIRVVSPSSLLRKFTRVIAVLFFFFWTALIVLKTWWCIKKTEFVVALGEVVATCPLRDSIVSFEVITDCISDATLVILSLKLLWRVKLPRRQRQMILSLFSSSAIMSVFSLFHAICQFGPLASVEFVAFDLEMTSALIVCNLLVVVTFMYRVIVSSSNGSLPPRSDSSPEDDDFTARTPSQAPATVELNTLDITIGPTYSNFTSRILSSTHSTVP